MIVRFHYDVVCPWAYLASTRMEAFAEKTGATVRWEPILLGGLFRHHGAPDRPGEAMSPARARMGTLDLYRWAERLGVPVEYPPAHPRRSVEAMRLLVGCDESARIPLTKALFRAYWVEGRDVADRAVLGAIAADHGVDVGIIDRPDVQERLFEVTAEAAAAGAFGVPTFRVGDDLWWGVDRLQFVEDAVKGACAAPLADGRPADGRRPAHRGPRLPGANRTLRFFHDFSSPFSYLASTQIERVAAEHGATVEWAPMLLGALFRDIGTANIPLKAMNPAKQRYTAKDLAEWARWWGVPFRFASTFPLRTVTPLRVSLVEPATIPVIYRAAWAEDRDVGDPAVLSEVLTAAGFDGASLIEAANDPAVKDQLRRNTEEARDLGACGAPTFLVRPGGVLIWGQDRLAHVEAALEGWRPERG